MTSRDLVGRPLVPFFDSDNNLNDSLQLGNDEREEMDIDARVWDKELGYFVYPSDQKGLKPVKLANQDIKTDGGSKLLLTPTMMLSSNVPDHLNSMGMESNSLRDGVHSTLNKRGLKPKSQSNSRRKNNKDEEASTTHGVSSKKVKSKNGNPTTGNSSTQSKQKEQLSASGKWAWSAFQSSPDPAELPMPPFLINAECTNSNASCLNLVAKAPAVPLPLNPLSSNHASAPIACSLPKGPPQSLPSRLAVPPDVATAAPMSIEVSMTQDLRRMLNIG
ncbi:hypothetical protein CCR75_004724 [Bremia lactucae]|uniref:Uncharacterized protein n=1 Tax=Bremia lactucae TaxID=4779 RepID=A0A976IJR5_BRELC|nr:hypothetical protein CCR75_004724 [Bremia lactucae]